MKTTESVKVELEDYTVDWPGEEDDDEDSDDTADDPTSSPVKHDMEAMESNLFHTPFHKSKLDRLNLECSDPFLQQNCVRGQKWRCINENGRWRKHKCKFLAQLQSHMDAISQFTSQSKRNCACFTKKGVIYTKIKATDKVANSVLRHKRDQFQAFTESMKALKDVNSLLKRRKRNLDEHIHLPHADLYQTILSLALQLDNLNRPSGNRQKRDVSGAMLDEIQRAFKNVEAKYREERVSNTTTGDVAKCFVRPDGQVSCSNIIYDDETAWRRSIDEIGDLIQVLKTKIDDLKSIKRHLRENRPHGAISDYDLDTFSSTEDYPESRRSRRPPTTAGYSDTEWSRASTQNRHRHKISSGPNRNRQRLETTAPMSESSTTERPPESYNAKDRGQYDRSTTPVYDYESSGMISWDDLYLFSSSSAPQSVEPSTTRAAPPVVQPTTQKNSDFKEAVSVGATIFEPIRNRKPTTTSTESYERSLNDTETDLDSSESASDKSVESEPAECYCEPEKELGLPNEKELVRQTRRRLKEQRQRKKERKRRRHDKMEGSCIFEKMNCFSHDADHWRTAPLWDDQPFCFCMNANNNTYSCVRTINETHNFLYCEFTTGLVTFYNLRIG